MGGPAFGLLCVLLLVGVIVVPLLTADLAKAYRQQQPHRGYGTLGAFEARRVTIKELSLRSSPPVIADRGDDVAGGCVFVADLLQSSGIGRRPKLGGVSPPGWHAETSAAHGWTRLSSGGGTELAGGHVELLLTHPAPHRPIRARLQDGIHVRELFFIPDLVGELSARDQVRLAALADADATFQEAPADLCEWAHRVVHLDDDGEEEEDVCGQRAVPRSKRQTEVIVINRRKKHHGGNGAAVAIGLGVGLGVGIPVVVLLALIPCVIALWLIRKRRRGSRTIRVADVPTGVFAAGGQPTQNPAYQEEPAYQESVSPIGSDLQSALGENY